MLSVDYRDETGSRSPSGRERDQRHYAVVRYQGPTGAPWKIDLSLWTAAGPDGEWHDIPGVRARLTAETRTAILWIKETLMAEGRYPGDVASVEIYDAVLNGGVRNPEAFALARR
ncbi:hypothetical protein [Pseudonocardia sp. TRM90224]|uniref:hypothetical protein n=1 Tax=Pseudonocardia sp. TRM90224 TaxID=2812678 RepID=UPI001E34B388|nr:hypothetical protein [Pseudonocardia sp. TRM90224]